MTARAAELSERDQQLGSAIVDCLQAVEAGRPLDEVLARNPQFAAELADFLDERKRLEQLAGPVRGALKPKEPGVTGTLVESGLLGDFRILREVGRGGMGIVYEAEQISLGRRVALKVLPFAAALDARQLQRFRNEAQAAALLHHQNIVPVYFVGHERGVHFYAMQFIDGRTVAAVISELRQGAERIGPPALADNAELDPASVTNSSPAARPPHWSDPFAWPVRRGVDGAGSEPETIGVLKNARPAGSERTASTTPRAHWTEQSTRRREFFRAAANLGIQAAEALEHAHQTGIIHRDIKPANLLVDGGGRLWVADFGLARLKSDSSLTMTGDLLGTLRYMSPEQALAQRVIIDHRTDIYSLAVTLYELLTLAPAYNGRDRQHLLRQIAFEEPRLPRRINPAIPAELETIIVKAAAKNPAERYATAKELADDLQRFLDDKPIRAKRPTLVHRVRKWARRHQPLVVTLTAAALVLLVTVATISTGAAWRIAGAQQRTQTALDQSRLLSAELALDKGQLLGERGEADLALHWLARALKLAPPDASDLQSAIRTSLGAWRLQVNRLQLALPHDNRVVGTAFMSGRGTLLTVCKDGQTVIVGRWDAATGRSAGSQTFAGGDAGLRVVAFSPNADYLLLGFSDGAVQLRDVASGKSLWETPKTSDGFSVGAAFSPDGKMVLVGYRVGAKGVAPVTGKAQLFEAATGKELLSRPLEHRRPVHAAAFHPDGKAFVTESGLWGNTAERGEARFWDLSGQEVRTPLEHPCMAPAVAFSPDGTKLLAGHWDFKARLWNLAASPEEEPLVLQHEGPVVQAKFSPDGTTLITGSFDGTVRLWSLSGRSLSPPLRCASLLQSMALAPNGKMLLCGDRLGTAWLWGLTADSNNGPRDARSDEFFPLAFSPDRLTLLCRGAGNTVQLHDAATHQPVGKPLSHNRSVRIGACSSDRRRAMTVDAGAQDAGNVARLWDTASGTLIAELKPFPRQSAQPRFFTAAFSHDGKILVTGSFDSTARVWDAFTGKLVGELKHHDAGPVFDVAFSPDGKLLLTGGADEAARFWDTETLEQVGHPLTPYTAVLSVAFSPDSKTVLAGGSQDIQLWDVASRRRIGRPMTHQGGVYAAAFSPDGRFILSGSREQMARLWDAATGKPIGPVLPHMGPVVRVAFGLRGKSFLTASEDNIARSWPLPSPMTAEAEALELWVQVVTGMELEADGSMRTLDAGAWQQRRQKLEGMGWLRKEDPVDWQWDSRIRVGVSGEPE